MRVLLVDGRDGPRQLLRFALEGLSQIEAVAEAKSPLQALAEASRLHPAVVLVDAGLRWADALETTRLMRDRVPDCRILLLNGEEDSDKLFTALRVGATGYLVSGHGLAELANALRVVRDGGLAIPRTMLGSLVETFIGRHEARQQASGCLQRLTPQERRVLLLLAQGIDNRAIGQRLRISPQTARTHVQRVLRKLGVHSRLEAMAFVDRHHLLAALEASDMGEHVPARAAQ